MNNDKIHIKNSLTIIGLYAGLVETGLVITIKFVESNLQSTLIWMMAILAFITLIGFFILLYFKPNNLYAPSDFQDDESYLLAQLLSNQINPKQINSEIQSQEDNTSTTSTPIEKTSKEDLRDRIKSKLKQYQYVHKLPVTASRIVVWFLNDHSAGDTLEELLLLARENIIRFTNQNDTSYINSYTLIDLN